MFDDSDTKKLHWYGHATRPDGIGKPVRQSIVDGEKSTGIQKKKCAGKNGLGWTASTQRQARNEDS